MPNTQKIPNEDPTRSTYPTNERVQFRQMTAPLLTGYVILGKALSTLSLSFLVSETEITSVTSHGFEGTK